MKNFILLIIVVALTTAIYFFEELDNLKIAAKAEEKSTLIAAENLGALKSFKTPRVHLNLKDGVITIARNGIPVDKEKINKIFKILLH